MAKEGFVMGHDIWHNELFWRAAVGQMIVTEQDKMKARLIPCAPHPVQNIEGFLIPPLPPRP